jgi:prephenate dehydrogenase
VKKIAIIGLGVIGASLGMSLRDAWPQLEVLGLDTNQDTMKQALAIGAATAVSEHWDVSGCDVVFIATPLRAIPEVLRAIAGSLGPGTLVTDVGSVKTAVMEYFKSILPPGMAAVGGHPMAGSEKSGITAADKHLFENAVYVLTPGENCIDGQLQGLRALVGVPVHRSR